MIRVAIVAIVMSALGTLGVRVSAASGGPTTGPDGPYSRCVATTMSDAVKDAELIVVGKVTSSVVGAPGSAGPADYGYNLVVRRVLKGTEERKEICVIARGATVEGDVVLVGETEYVFFLKTSAMKGYYDATRIVLASPKNVADVIKAVSGSATTQKD